jgi:hypothetical protein
MPTPQDPATKPTLFVSYSRKDAPFVDALVKALEARGYDVSGAVFAIRPPRHVRRPLEIVGNP